MNEILRNVGLVVMAYLLGSIPFGVIVAKSKGIDIMSVGSGNMGTTNVSRALGCKLGLLVFILDTVKGAIPAVIGLNLFHDQFWALCLGLCALVGHSLSPFVKFKGGKGVASGLGAISGSIPLLGVSGMSTFIIVLALTRYVSLSSIIAIWSIAITSIFVTTQPAIPVIFILLASFVTYRHKDNIARLRAGTERKFQFKKSEEIAVPVQEPSGDPVNDSK